MQNVSPVVGAQMLIFGIAFPIAWLVAGAANLLGYGLVFMTGSRPQTGALSRLRRCRRADRR